MKKIIEFVCPRCKGTELVEVFSREEAYVMTSIEADQISMDLDRSIAPTRREEYEGFHCAVCEFKVGVEAEDVLAWLKQNGMIRDEESE